MSENGAGRLYTPALLNLAVDLANYPLDDTLPRQGEAVSRTCGSRLAMGLACDADGAIERIGMQVSACAVGQAAAAVFAAGAAGRDHGDVVAAEHAIADWLAGGPDADWPGIDAIAAAREHPGRHEAILLPWRAARAALSNASAAE
ncbi:iron-sulfur cluster assembly scaffold protein [Pelagerythrobacter marensis]|uniref:Iron-sulfur cluster assembly scaffold protein n=1 Tax=Pelagerythrobacter marensis TaxID=543877 RepID=A0ABZ2D2H6_9SPHN